MKFLKFLAFLLPGIFCFQNGWSQMKNYEKEWEKIDQLIGKQNRPQSALTEVKKIYSLAKKEKQDAQVIKALIYMSDLQESTRENNSELSIREMEKEIAGAKEPMASLLKSITAGMYWTYLQNHRWEFYQRTNTVNFNKDDIATWTIDDFHKKISELYLASIQHEALLKSQKLEKYDAIIYKGNVRHLRPTLYDLLAHHALIYFKNDERLIARPAYAFEINQVEAFAPADQFIKVKFTTKDSFSLHHKALLIYQNLIAFHLNDSKPDALIDVDIARIQFVKQHATIANKDSLYLTALDQIIARYEGQPAIKQAQYLKALWYEENAVTYSPFGDTTHRMARVIARNILRDVVKDSSEKNEGWINSHNLLQTIEKPSFSFDLEQVNIPNQPFRSLVKYRNVGTLYFRILKASEVKEILKKAGTEDQSEDDLLWHALLNTTPLKEWKQELPRTNDLQEHSVEIKIEALPSGEYYLIACSNPSFAQRTYPLGARSFWTSNISYVNMGNQYFLLHRETGQPLVNASVTLYKSVYDNVKNRYVNQAIDTYQTDVHGYFQYESDNLDEYPKIEVVHQGEKLFIDRANYSSRFYYNYDLPYMTDDMQEQFFVFTDRSIYRPGQVLYFKGIALKGRNKQYQIVTGYNTTIYLRNANNEKIDSINLTTNEFGSFHGKFQLPFGNLNGPFSLTSDGDPFYADHYADVYVEEYKRPKFFVEFETVKESYKVEDEITVTGVAKAYAGNNIDGARVNYRVVRESVYPSPMPFVKIWPPYRQSTEITQGVVATDAKGEFQIRFKAIPDHSVDRELNPLFEYHIYVDVTDISGETRSAHNTVKVGYASLLLHVNTPSNNVAVDSLKWIEVRTTNLNGEFQRSHANLKFFRLHPEKRLIRPRYWERPDQFVMTKDEFVANFPHDEYSNETEVMTWPRESSPSIIIEDSTNSNGLWSIPGKVLRPGHYLIETVAKDKDGNPVKNLTYIYLFDSRSSQLNDPEYIRAVRHGNVISPGEKVVVEVASSAGEVHLIQQIYKRPADSAEAKNGHKNELHGVSFFSFTTLNNKNKAFVFSATEEDRGGYGFVFFFVKHNRLFQFGDNIHVPWNNKKLDIEFLTFRDKTQPGSKETWKVKIKGHQNEKVAAEMLASMYDASLDQFRYHGWSKPDIWPTSWITPEWNGGNNFTFIQSLRKEQNLMSLPLYKEYDQIRSFARFESQYRYMSDSHVVTAGFTMPHPPLAKAEGGTYADGISYEHSFTTSTGTPDQDIPVQVRRNFNETAFFYPGLRTDADGNIEFSFTVPEALTKWKFQALAHTKELAFGLLEKEMVTQKELMVQPNLPRFLRQGDRMEIPVKIVNISSEEITGQVELMLFDAGTSQSVDGWFMNSLPNQYFTVAAGSSEVVNFPIQVPVQFSNALTVRIIAKGAKHSDGEENILPVLSNKMLVTETLPIWMNGSGTKQVNFDKLLQSENSSTLQHHALTIEYTSNPAWYAVQALPYLMEYPYECAEQTWNRYYANALASKIINSAPRVKQIFERWKTLDTAALLSNLEKNQELKSALLEETPWVLAAKSESEQRKNIALLFDMVRLNATIEGILSKLEEMQSPNGGFAWFKDGPADRYITQYILTGIGHLKKLDVDISSLDFIVEKAISYLDKKIREDYEKLTKNKADLNKQQISQMQIQYLYMRSFFPEIEPEKNVSTAFNYYQKQAGQFWMNQNSYMQGMIALALHRAGQTSVPKKILVSLKENSIYNEELGRYWKDNTFGRSWFWHQAPIETHSLLIEVFTEIGGDTKTVNELKTWLIKNKQTNNWRTTKATADACYAMMLQGSEWLAAEPTVNIKLGTITIDNTSQPAEAGTGYIKQTIAGEKINPSMGSITLNVQHQSGNEQPSWGAVYWQYFEEMDKITMAATPLRIDKKLFVETNTDRGPVLTPVEEGSELHVGDKIKVRIELRVDRDMEYVHMKDMRAAGLEPVNVLSGYRWQGGLGYYETTKDASTNFFFDYLRKGTYVFEYTLFVTHTGTFNNGITTIQCMYAPEFTAHSEGEVIRVEND